MKIQRILALARQTGFIRNLSVGSLSVESNRSSHLHNIEDEEEEAKDRWVTIRRLFDARVHLGHREGSLEPLMTGYIWGSRLGHLILDLDKTQACLNRALDVATEITAKGGIVLFVTRFPQHCIPVEKAALKVKEYAHTREWRQGTLTNSLMLFGAVTRLPDVIISIGSHPALLEAAKMLIPSIAILDTDCDPKLVTYPVPGNDDTPAAVQLYLDLFMKAVEKGKQRAADLDQTSQSAS